MGGVQPCPPPAGTRRGPSAELGRWSCGTSLVLGWGGLEEGYDGAGILGWGGQLLIWKEIGR